MANLNLYPYYDDYNELKNYMKILFKPGIAVQARELTQIQSILQNQITKFGNHIFKNGSIVIPGNSKAELGVPFIDITTSSVESEFNNKIIVGYNTKVKASVKHAVMLDNRKLRLYIKYISGGINAESFFDANESIFPENSSSFGIIGTNSTGIGSLASINDGVFYINGAFVNVYSQTVVISSDTDKPSCSVMLKIVDEIVDASEDTTLTDPAQGSYNYNAPGADRLKTSLILSVVPIDAPVSDNYIEIMRYRDGNLEEHNLYPSYSELEKSLARRTYDEAGDYCVNGFGVQAKEHLRTKFNDGLYENGDRDKFVLSVTPGKAYIKGFEVEKSSTTNIEQNKARTSDHIKSKKISNVNSYGQYIYVTNLKSLPRFDLHEEVTFYDSPNNPTATSIGKCNVVGIDYLDGDPTSQNSIYKLYIHDLSLNSNMSLKDAGEIRFGGGSAIVVTKFTITNSTKDFSIGEIIVNSDDSRSAIVVKGNRSTGELYVYKNLNTKPIPFLGETITGESSNSVATVKNVNNSSSFGGIPIFTIPENKIKSTTNLDTGLFDISYSTWKTVVINTDSVGDGETTISSGVFKQPEVGVTVAASPGGIIPVSLLSVNVGNTISITGGPPNSAITILTQVDKNAIQAKTKTLVTVTMDNITPAKLISLGKCDIYKINYIFSGTTDVTDAYILDNGQTDYYYGVGKLLLNGKLPTENLSIQFQYFKHSGSGDYFSINSYTTLGSEYMQLAPTYNSAASATNFYLGNCLDFRPRQGDDGLFTSPTASINDPIVVDNITTTSIQYYVPRFDVIYIDQGGNISVVNGAPQDMPLIPTIPENCIEIATVLVPAYTESIDSIRIKRADNFRYTMQDINKLEKRIKNVEYYSTLNAVENSLLSYEVIDPITGLNRFKSGYLVDNFDNPFTINDFFNRYNTSTFSERRLTAQTEFHDTHLNLTGLSSDYQITNGQITLPYVEVEMIKQNTSTRITNVNPFMIFAWEGIMTIHPSIDSWVETEDLPTIYRTNTETINVTREVRYDPPPPPAPPPPQVPIVEQSPPAYTPAPAPAPEPAPVTSNTQNLVEIFAYSRDLGIVDPGDTNNPEWSNMRSFYVDPGVVTAFYASTGAIPGVDYFATRDPLWAQYVRKINELYWAGGARIVDNKFTTTPKYSVDYILDYWGY